ncbi:MAG TPA: histone deacetylase [Thermoanaerobacterales bacterium]|nr:histone deacetylase [Thermoanaerobacterales bacterium]
MLKAKNRLGLVFFPAFDWAISSTHPEREERLLYTRDQVEEEGLFDIDGIIEYNPKMASYKDVQRVHLCVPDEKSRMTESHLISAGGAITAAEAVIKGEVDKAFALVRPPGHHAMRVVHGARGFCNINIEAVMINYIRKHYGIKKIAIVDTDCHHGDGTQDIYWNDPDTLFISLHQDGRTLYPGSGYTDEIGGPNAVGYTLNIPLPPGTSDEGFLYALDNLILPVIEEFQPELIINSAGQDNHYTDPITNMNFSASGYATLNDRLDPHIAVLEGGYSIEGALPYVNTGIILAMAGLDYSNVKEPDFEPGRFRETARVMEHIKDVCEEVYRTWKNRSKYRQKMIKDAKYLKERRSIYYDTDGISESREEIIKICDCSGYSILTSTSDRGYTIRSVIIPWNSCPKCHKEGLEAFEKIREEKGFPSGIICLQDGINDIFIRETP